MRKSSVDIYETVSIAVMDDSHKAIDDPNTRRDWRWRLKAGNGEIVASGEGYTRREDALRGFRDMVKSAIEAEAQTYPVDDDPDE